LTLTFDRTNVLYIVPFSNKCKITDFLMPISTHSKKNNFGPYLVINYVLLASEGGCTLSFVKIFKLKINFNLKSSDVKKL
jgi:hypothetical protein